MHKDPLAEEGAASGPVRIRAREARRGALIACVPRDPSAQLRAACESFADEGYEVVILEDGAGAALTAAELLGVAADLEGPRLLLDFGARPDAAFDAAPAGGPFSALALFGAPGGPRLAETASRAPLLVNLCRDDPRLPAAAAAAETAAEGRFRLFVYGAPEGFAAAPGFEDARTLALLRVRQHFHRAVAGRERGA